MVVQELVPRQEPLILVRLKYRLGQVNTIDFEFVRVFLHMDTSTFQANVAEHYE